MNVAGGVGGQVGDLPVYISAIRAESAVARSGKIQVSETSRNFHEFLRSVCIYVWCRE